MYRYFQPTMLVFYGVELIATQDLIFVFFALYVELGCEQRIEKLSNALYFMSRN